MCIRDSVVDDGSDGYMGWGRMLKNDSILVDRNYTVHINSENENELKQIYQAFLYPPIYPSLGRWENTIRIDEVKIVNVEDEEKEEKLKAFSWLPPVSYTHLDVYKRQGKSPGNWKP